MKTKTIFIAGGIAAVAVGAYLVLRKKGPTPSRIEQQRKESVAHLIQTSSDMMTAVQEGGRAALQVPEGFSNTRSGLTDVLKFGTAKPVAGLGYAMT